MTKTTKVVSPMSPPPDPTIIHSLRKPDGEVIRTDNQWRRIIGTYTYPDGQVAEVGLTEEDCLQGILITGRPGSGKAVDLETMIMQDIERKDTLNVGKGGSESPWNSVVVVDPDGDFTYDLLDRLPHTHEGITALVDPLDQERVVAMGSFDRDVTKSQIVQRLLTQRVSTVKLRNAIDKGHITLFRFSPQLGADKSFLLTLAFNLVKQALSSRTDISIEQRRMVSVYLDEFQEIVGSDSANLQNWLEQAGEFGGAITLAHQNLEQVKHFIEAIKGTIGSKTPMLVGADDRDFYARYLSSEAWPEAQIARAFAKLPRFSKVAKLFDLGKDFTPVLLNSLPRTDKAQINHPRFLAVKDSSTVYGYRIEPYNEGLHGTLQASIAYGMEDFWEPSAKGRELGIQPISPGFCPNLIEELTVFLRKTGVLQWGLCSHDPRSEELGGFSPQEIARIDASSGELKEAQQLLLDIERLGSRQREDALTGLDERKWLLYRMSRKGRDRVLRKVLLAKAGIISERRNRIITLSRLWKGTPIPEIEAEAARR